MANAYAAADVFKRLKIPASRADEVLVWVTIQGARCSPSRWQPGQAAVRIRPWTHAAQTRSGILMSAPGSDPRLPSRLRQWLTVGLGIKRWLLLLALGSAAAGVGVVYLIIWLRLQGFFPAVLYDIIILRGWPTAARVLVPVAVGGGVILFALLRLSRSLTAPFRQEATVSLSESLYEHRQTRQRQRGPFVVAIGGGTGLASLLRGLTAHTRNITSIVTMADDGGSSGRLRRELGLLPPGDLRNNMAALARDEALMTQLLQYRFGDNLNLNSKSELQGHSFGNLLLAALIGITGSFDEALLAAERVLALRGRVLPSTLMDVTLVADVEVGDPPRVRQVVGESAIPEARGAHTARFSAAWRRACLPAGAACHLRGGPDCTGAGEPVY